MSREEIPEYNFREEYEQLGFEIIKLEYFYSLHSIEERTNPHRLKFYALIYITKGRDTHIIDFTSHSYKEGSLIFVSKNQVHAWGKKNKIGGYIIFFTEAFLYKNQIQFNDLSYSYPYNYNLYSPVLQTKGIITKVFTQLIKLLYNEYNHSFKNIQEELLQCLLRVLILKIQDSTPSLINNASKETEALFVEFQKQLDQNISLTRNAIDYCNMLNVSYHQLNKTIKTLTNKTIKAFIDDFVILQAKRLLADPTNNANEVSYALGFEESTNFSKFFKKHTGIPPKLFSDRLIK
ncbi:helix-turn-helix transcriptional regulator [Polaribacter ponticola]|uniref:Helix-turn-helix transcriptional regulator n=1 Tax=Polaribacter ponticola TaxID=2978475 RepID=A0ABT5S7J3_9FLAO|nr:helix-turn-helix transcriptional regulator [Polaribacter sp. MSW5]MDD7914043.1 helix-turn-helix transcriptional regulator [Polaribacter sp. MSW5]